MTKFGIKLFIITLLSASCLYLIWDKTNYHETSLADKPVKVSKNTELSSMMTIKTSQVKAKAKKKTDKLEMLAKSLMKKNHLAGSIAIVRGGKLKTVSYGQALTGVKNGDQRVVYPVASLTKQITGAMIIAIMSKNKTFNQDTKISRWYPNLAGADKITVGNLLTHTSGLQIPEIEDDRGVNYTEMGTVNWTVNRLNQAEQNSVGVYGYSDVNYILLAGIINKVTGKSYRANFERLIVKRLGLHHTFLFGQVPKGYRVAESYSGQNQTSLTKTRMSQLVGAAQVVTMPSDYYKFVSSLGTKLLTPSDYYLMTHLKSKKTQYSSGFYIKKNGRVKLAYGAIGGMHYGSYYQLTSNNKNGIVMFVNRRSINRNQLKAVGYQILKRINSKNFSKI